MRHEKYKNIQHVQNCKGHVFMCTTIHKNAYNGIWPTILLNKSVHGFEVYMELPCQELYTMQPLRMHSISIIKLYFWQNAAHKIVLHVREMIFIGINAYSSNNNHNAHGCKTYE